jgi:hypothetical protein
MSPDALHEFTVYFGDLEDPRDNNARHHLHELLLIELCALLCGAEDCSDMALFGRAKEEYLRQCRKAGTIRDGHLTVSGTAKSIQQSRSTGATACRKK